MDTQAAMATFVAVAREGSFSAASRRLGLSTTAVSRHVAELEQSLGVTLLRRTTRHVSPTDAGAQYLPRAAAILDEIERLNSEVSSIDQAPRGRLRITAPPAIGRDWIAPLMIDFAKLYPEIDIELDLAERMVDLVAEGFDAAFRAGPLRSSTLIAHKVLEVEYRLCASPDYLGRRGTPKTPQDVADHDCINWVDAVTVREWTFTRNGRSQTVPIHCRLLLSGQAVHHQAALRGLGLVRLPVPIVRDDLEAGRLVSVLPDYRVYHGVLSLVRPPTPFEPTKLRVFIDFITEALRGNRDMVWI